MGLLDHLVLIAGLHCGRGGALLSHRGGRLRGLTRLGRPWGSPRMLLRPLSGSQGGLPGRPLNHSRLGGQACGRGSLALTARVLNLLGSDRGADGALVASASPVLVLWGVALWEGMVVVREGRGMIRVCDEDRHLGLKGQLLVHGATLGVGRALVPGALHEVVGVPHVVVLMYVAVWEEVVVVQGSLQVGRWGEMVVQVWVPSLVQLR